MKITEMLEQHPEIEYICLLWIWKDNGCETNFIRTGDWLPAKPIYKTDELDLEYSYIGPYISDDDKAQFIDWMIGYDSDEKFEDLRVEDIKIFGSPIDYGLKVKCLLAIQCEENPNVWGKGWNADFTFEDVKWGSYCADPDGVFDEKTFDLLWERKLIQ